MTIQRSVFGVAHAKYKPVRLDQMNTIQIVQEIGMYPDSVPGSVGSSLSHGDPLAESPETTSVKKKSVKKTKKAGKKSAKKASPKKKPSKKAPKKAKKKGGK